MAAPSPLKISPILLGGIYAVAPLLVAVCAADLVFFSGALRSLLPSSPMALLWFVVLFNVPHHVASLFSFADVEYLRFYRLRLLGLPFLLAAFGALLWYSPSTALIGFILNNEYHVMSQHTGMLRLLARPKGWVPEVWRWTGMAIGAIAFGIVLPGPYQDLLASLGVYSLLPLLVTAFALVSAWLVVKAPTAYARLAVVAIAAGVGSTVAFLGMGYVFFAILVSRFLHDAAAFAFYIAHDHNRSASGKNALYALVSKVGAPIYVLVPVLAVALAYFLQRGPFELTAALLFLYMTHYYVEGFVWKRGSLHREQIALA